LAENVTDQALIGNSLADKMFVSPLHQEIILSNKNYRIAGICVDPFNNGNVTYVPRNSLPLSMREFGFNLLFLKINPENRSQALSELDSALSGVPFEFLELNIVLDENVGFLGNAWSLVMLLPLTSLLTAIFCLFTYLTLAITFQQREFGIMRAIGIKLKSLVKIVVLQVLMILLASAASGVSLGILIISLFLIPEPVISFKTVSYYSGLLIFITVFFALFSLYFAFKMIRKPIQEALYPF
jgi:ABC-type antimicrobial peptide transport system permease subunit